MDPSANLRTLLFSQASNFLGIQEFEGFEKSWWKIKYSIHVNSIGSTTRS